MTCKELAELLDGRQYLNEISLEEQEKAKDSGLVVVFGYSDDNIEFTGAIRDEIGCYEGGKVYVKDGKIFKDNFMENGMPIDERYAITAIFAPKNPYCSWIYKTDIPHETFKIYEDDELYCVGIVFDINRLEETTERKNQKINIKPLISILEQYKLSDEQAEELQKVIDKLDDGLLVELPCKVGDTVYVDAMALSIYLMDIMDIKEENLPAYFVGEVVSFRITEKKKLVHIRIQEQWLDDFYFVSFGKTVFLTREEAEKALQEVKENDKQ